MRVKEPPAQKEEPPVIVVVGFAAIEIVNVLAVLLPQPFTAITEIIPPEPFEVTVIEFDVEVPVQPVGKVQV